MRKIRYIDAIFEKDEKGKHYTGGALLLQDLLRYSLVINELPLKLDVPFKKRHLHNWIVRHNKEIVDYYKKTIRRNKTSYSNRIHAKEERLDDNFEILLRLNLIKVGGIAAAEKTGAPVSLYKYTKGGILLTLITKSIDLKEVIFITTTAHKKQVDKINHDLYQIVDSAFEIEEDSSAAIIFYSTLFQNCKEKGIFDKLVERMHHIINSDNNIANMIDLLQRAVYSAFFDKQSETDLLDTLYETVEELDQDNKKLILYRIKMFAENKFENTQEDLTRKYEKFHFKMKNDYERIAIQGYCENCRSRQNVAVHYMDLRKISPQNGNDLRMDCSSCTTENSIVISNFYY